MSKPNVRSETVNPSHWDPFSDKSPGEFGGRDLPQKKKLVYLIICQSNLHNNSGWTKMIKSKGRVSSLRDK